MAKILAFSGSLRAASLNRKLLKLAASELREAGAEVTIIDLNDYELPFYNQELQDGGFPEASDKLRELVEAHDAVLIVTPEYNFSFPAVVKNVLDWLSRYRPQPFGGKHGLLMSASPGLVGGNRGLWALRVPLECMGVHVHPNMFSLAQANKAFADDGTLAEDVLSARLKSLAGDFVSRVDKANA